MHPLAIVLTTALVSQQPPAAAASQGWFQQTEQALMDAVAAGDRSVWDRVMDDTCVVTGEEGEKLTKAEFLKGLRPLPQGLSGTIVVRELTVQDVDNVAIVRFLLDESETVFGQQVTRRHAHVRHHRRSARAAGSDRRLVEARRHLPASARRLVLPRRPEGRSVVWRTRPERAAAIDSNESDRVRIEGIAGRVAVRHRPARERHADRESAKVRAAGLDPRREVKRRKRNYFIGRRAKIK
jgi:hypothetical protein